MSKKKRIVVGCNNLQDLFRKAEATSTKDKEYVLTMLLKQLDKEIVELLDTYFLDDPDIKILQTKLLTIPNAENMIVESLGKNYFILKEK